MPREIFHRELNHLVEEVVELGREVESCLNTMVEALEKHDDETARKELGIDSRYKERGSEIDEECMILQARQAPEAGDPEWRVRAALTVHYLERIADHGVDIGRRTVFLVTGERMESAMSQYRNRQIEGYDE